MHRTGSNARVLKSSLHQKPIMVKGHPDWPGNTSSHATELPASKTTSGYKLECMAKLALIGTPLKHQQNPVSKSFYSITVSQAQSPVFYARQNAQFGAGIRLDWMQKIILPASHLREVTIQAIGVLRNLRTVQKYNRHPQTAPPNAHRPIGDIL